MKYLVLFCSVLFLTSVEAQTLESNLAELTGEFIACPDNKVEMPFAVTNTLATPVTAQWYVTRIDVPSQWQVQVCDANLCYAWTVENCPEGANRYNEFEPNESIDIFSIKVGIDVNGFAQDGIGTFEFVMFNALDSSDIFLTLPFEVTGTACMSSTLTTEENEITSLYPNPTTGVLNVDQVDAFDALSFYDLNGNLVKRITNVSSVIDVSDLTSGMYLARMYNQDGKQVKVQKLIVL